MKNPKRRCDPYPRCSSKTIPSLPPSLPTCRKLGSASSESKPTTSLAREREGGREEGGRRKQAQRRGKVCTSPCSRRRRAPEGGKEGGREGGREE